MARTIRHFVPEGHGRSACGRPALLLRFNTSSPSSVTCDSCVRAATTKGYRALEEAVDRAEDLAAYPARRGDDTY